MAAKSAFTETFIKSVHSNPRITALCTDILKAQVKMYYPHLNWMLGQFYYAISLHRYCGTTRKRCLCCAFRQRLCPKNKGVHWIKLFAAAVAAQRLITGIYILYMAAGKRIIFSSFVLLKLDSVSVFISIDFSLKPPVREEKRGLDEHTFDLSVLHPPLLFAGELSDFCSLIPPGRVSWLFHPRAQRFTKPLRRRRHPTSVLETAPQPSGYSEWAFSFSQSAAIKRDEGSFLNVSS